MIKKLICFALILCMVSMVGCGQSNSDLSEVRTQYIGDNVKVAQIASSLKYPDGVSYESIEIQSSKEPYELKVYLNVDGEKELNLTDCADDAFGRIDNMGIISFYNKKNDSLIGSFNRK